MSETLTHDDLVEAVKSRQSENEFNYGIVTADRYIKTISECLGSDACYKFMAKGTMSFDDLMKKAAKSLTYNNPDMIAQDIYSDVKSGNTIIDGVELELPKNTLMVFRHTLTTPRKDRDGDILRTQGARIDPKMLLLWQHVHTLPIGKFLAIYEHNSKTLDVYSAIVDMNDLSHDSAVMVDNGMGRFSHGFKAIEFVSMKEEQGKVTKPGGFDVKAFEILEESLVSVPSNVDADTQEVIVSLVEGGKMTSSVMKNMGKEFRQKMPKQFNLPIDIKLTLNGKPINEDKSGNGEDEAGTKSGKKCGCGGTSKEADADGAGDKDSDSENKEVTQANADAHNDMGSQVCPECGITASDDGKCPQCGKALKKAFDNTKSGRVLSSTNYKKLQDAHEDLAEVHEHCSTRSGKALCNGARQKIFDVLNTQQLGDEQRSPEFTIKDAMALVITKATSEERRQMIKTLQGLEDIAIIEKQTESYKKAVGKKNLN